MESGDKIMEILIQTEKVADEVLMNKSELVVLDKRRQEQREAIRDIEKLNEKKVWITIGSMLVKMEREKALNLLKKDQEQISIEINKIRSNQKELVNKLRDLEHSTPLQGFDLKPLNSQELSALRNNNPLF